MATLKDTNPEYFEIFGDAWRFMGELFPVNPTPEYFIDAAVILGKYSDKWRGNKFAIDLLVAVFYEVQRVWKEKKGGEKGETV